MNNIMFRKTYTTIYNIFYALIRPILNVLTIEIKCYVTEIMDWTWYIIILTTVRISWNFKVDEQGLASCLVELCKRIIPTGSTIFFSSPIVNYSHYGKGHAYPFQFKKRTFNLNHNRLCNHNSRISAFYLEKNPAYAPVKDKINISHSLENCQNSILYFLHLLQRWPITLSPIFSSVDNRLQKTRFNYYILLTRHKNSVLQSVVSDLKKHLEMLIDSETFNSQAKFIIVLTGEIGFYILADTLINYLHLKSVYEVFIVLQTEDSISVYTWFPFRYPSGDCSFFKKSILLYTYLYGSLVKKHDYFETDIYSNCTVGTAVRRQEPFTILEKAESGKLYIKDGLFPRVLKIIATQMKFSDEGCTEEIGNCDTIARDSMYRNDQSVTNFFTIELTFFMLHSERYPGWSSVLRVFTWAVWLSFVSCMLATGLFFIYCSRFVYDSHLYRSFVSSVLHLWTVILGSSVREIPHSFALRLSFISWVIFSLCVNTVFQTYVTTYLIDPGFKRQIDTLEELKNLNYNLGICESTVFDHFAVTTEFMGQSYLFTETRDCILFSLLVPNSAVLINEEAFIYNIQRICKAYDIPYYHKLTKTVINMNAGLEFITSREVHKKMNLLIGRLVPAGIPDKLVRDVMNENGIGLKVGLTFENKEYEPISIAHLQSPFLVMFIGFVCSLIALCGEKLFYSVRL
ncbi:Ionotropic receptor 785 [Blattella germanica]|nr:Ionotropic receptor 785 [Blattella germanica]